MVQRACKLTGIFSLAVGYLARFGSGIFLIVQMVILLDFAQTWNDTW